ncbi:hypothetical protein [Bradyrhizobium glycinis]|uniref:hypothetical protein n=1 Tax=Bradyrhizobium glycinis TaxID=2751812 RepID=UPI0018D99DCF|nr:hypothetical protein [Bradyrhizobium glycinis]MBH5371364.1 hypothetical protein [Bradyrhizobium glycinis]
MADLPDQELVRIAKSVASANGVSIADVQTAPAIDSTGHSAVEIKLVITQGSSTAIMGRPSARTVSELIRELADRGDDRLPIVRYEEVGVSGS